MPTYWSVTVMNNSNAVSGFEISLVQICQWLGQTDMHTFMVNRINI